MGLRKQKKKVFQKIKISLLPTTAQNGLPYFPTKGLECMFYASARGTRPGNISLPLDLDHFLFNGGYFFCGITHALQNL
jgi:hypothetical protein